MTKQQREEFDLQKFFEACDNCDPLLCCDGSMCGCRGMPYDFKYTEDCGEECKRKKVAERIEK